MNTPAPTPIIPVSLSKTDDRHLLIQWSDDAEQKIAFRKLRQGCRCAHCLEKHGQSEPTTTDGKPKLQTELRVLSHAETLPLDIVSMEPAGNYGYKIRFSDGHSSGIYSFELLREIGNSVS